MFSISTDRHLYCKKEDMIKYCVKCFKQIDEKLKSKYIENFINDIIINYFSSNNFHNFTHAFEVFQMSFYLQKCNTKLSQRDRKLLLVAALCHDINHIGLSNTSLKRTKKDSYVSVSVSVSSSKDIQEDVITSYNEVLNKAGSYDSIYDIVNTDSYNEMIHIQQTTIIMSRHMQYIFNIRNLSDIESINQKISSLILSTDLKLNNKYIEIIDEKHDADSLTQMMLILKLADISHPCRLIQVHMYWVFKLIAENNNTFDESLSYLAKDTLFFMKTFVEPLLLRFIKLHDKNKYQKQKCKFLQDNFNNNIKQWENYI